MNNIEHFDQLRETTVTMLRTWAKSEGSFPEKELNAFFYWFVNDKDKGHRRIAAKQLVIECITAYYGSDSETFLNDLEDKLYKLIDKQETIPCVYKVAKNRSDAEQWLNIEIMDGDTLQEITEPCRGGGEHTKIYVLDWNGYRVQCVMICPGCWSMADIANIIE